MVHMIIIITKQTKTKLKRFYRNNPHVAFTATRPQLHIHGSQYDHVTRTTKTMLGKCRPLTWLIGGITTFFCAVCIAITGVVM